MLIEFFVAGDSRMNARFRIRKAHKRDWQRIAGLHSSHNRPIRRDPSISDYFVAFASDELIGTSAVHFKSDTGYLYGLVVARQWRKQGIGHALLYACLDHLRKARVKRVLALVMFWNIRFFRKHGFTLIKRTSIPAAVDIHEDFTQEWSRHSALLCADLLADCSHKTVTRS
jgi:N-acetylglutamate synthase-like GNAT family acetyltransferase